MRARLRSILTLSVLLASVAACGGGPQARGDWRMADRTLDVETDQPGRGDADVAGADGIVDDYDNAQGRLIPAVNGNISSTFPDDGRYEVALDACASQGATRFVWFVDAGAAIESTECETRVALPEGQHEIALTVRDASGASDTTMESAQRFGWTSSQRWWQDSRGHGYCSPDSDNFFFRTIFHPRDPGYAAKSAVLVAEAERLGVVP